MDAGTFHGASLLSLPLDWQEKARNEFKMKLQLCIPQDDVALHVANLTWDTLITGNVTRESLASAVTQYLENHGNDFAEWTIDFCTKVLDYYRRQQAVSTEPQQPPTAQPRQWQQHNAVSGTTQQASHGHLNPQAGARNIQNGAGNFVDPLDDSLDNLIRRQKLAKLQGYGTVPLGASRKSSKFQPIPGATESPFGNGSADDANESFNNLQAPPQGHVSANGTSFGGPQGSMVQKVPKVCINWPNCLYGDQCRYIHPSGNAASNNRMCKNWPKCQYGQKCNFTHPRVPCKFQKACTNPNCNYTHL